jgi:hypothetical protein
MNRGTGVFTPQHGSQLELYRSSVKLVLIMRLGLALIFCSAYAGYAWIGL